MTAAPHSSATISRSQLSQGEFIPLIAVMISLIALSIDAMLPALAVMGEELGVEGANDQQLIVTALFLGLGVSQMFFGPLSDSIGRKKAIYGGYVIFIIGCAMCIMATTFEVMIAGRVLQGVGAASPRIVSMALVRDLFKGREMARIMSFIMTVFILVPAVAPMIGQGIIIYFDWRAIFVVFLILAFVSWAWFTVRQPETLPPEKRVPFSVFVIWTGIKMTCSLRIALGYTLAAGCIMSSFVGFLSSAPQIFTELFGITEQFPLYFAVLALSFGISSIINGKLVVKLGMQLLSSYAIKILTSVSFLYLIYMATTGGVLTLPLVMIYFIVTFMCVGLLFGNFNALAMEPLGHIAGVGAAVVGSLSTLISVALGGFIGYLFNGTVVPLISGFAILGVVTLSLIVWAERGRIAEETS